MDRPGNNNPFGNNHAINNVPESMNTDDFITEVYLQN